MISKATELYKALVRMPVILDNLVTEFNRLGELIRYRPERPIEKPFVVILIQAVKVIKYDDGFLVKTKLPVTLCASGYAPCCFFIQPDIPIANLQIAVICDVSKVAVRQILVGNQHVCPSLEAAPIAYYEYIVEPSIRITIDVITR